MPAVRKNKTVKEQRIVHYTRRTWKDIYNMVLEWKNFISDENGEPLNTPLQNCVDVEKIDGMRLLQYWWAADHLDVPDVKERVYNIFATSDDYSATDAISWYKICLKKGVTEIAELMLERAAQSFLTYVRTLYFKLLDIKTLVAILDHDQLYVNSELEVFYAASDWLHAKIDQRRRYVPDLFKTFRTRELDKEFSGSIGELTFILPYEAKPRTRNYIYDPRCPYKHILLTAGAQRISCDEFFEYTKGLLLKLNEFLRRITPRR